MNNIRVRIYDLSKELNLDNKDIINICNQLNIVVKSHSSTITESEAERIRVEAETYIPTQVESKGNGSSATDEDESAKQHRQQILAIHRHNRPQSSDKTVERGSTPVLMAPPQPPVKPKPTVPKASAPELKPTTIKEPPKPQVKEKELPQPQASQPSAPPTIVEKTPELLGPPGQPKQEKASSKTQLKPSPKPVKSTGKPKAQKVETKEEEKPKSLPKLQKLPRPKPPQQEPKEKESTAPPPESELEEKDVDEDVLLDAPKKIKPKLKRPTPIRPGKSKSWEEEEEEPKDKAAKSKAGKVKRRSQAIIEEDEEDLATELEGVVLPTSVSLSIARPPKPKSETDKTAAAAASGPKKAPRPTPKTESAQTRTKSTRRDHQRTEERPQQVILAGSLTVRELSDLLKVAETDIIKTLFFKGIIANITQTLDLETATLVAEEFEIEVKTPEAKAAAAKSTEMLDAADLENLQRRPPVVTIMGHVDHGKTTLLDSIRQTKVAQGEAGGITQHIGAYHVDLEHNGKQEQIVFLDTPGHEAFTAMRARGTKVTDIAVLVVAADDGVQPQTREAISHARAAEVPIVIAINKIDKPGCEPDRVKQELTELELIPEEWGGETIMVPVSALKGENLDTLLEMILLVAEIEELSANPNRPAKGTVIEANLDRTRGPIATLLVQNGTLHVGDTIVAGSVFGKIRAMIDDRGNRVEEATPSFAVEVLGLNEVPAAGDEFDVFESEKDARVLAEQRTEAERQSRLRSAMSSRRVTLSSVSEQAREGELKELNLIIKADVQGSVEAILGSLKQLPQNEVQIRVLLAAPGEVTETDVDLAAASGAVIVGFNTTLASGARQLADQEGVDIREYNVIYKLLDDIQGAMEGLLEPEEVEEPLGQAQVRAIFSVGRGAVAGCYVLSGKVVRNRFIRVRRDGEIVYQGVLDSLKRIKEDAREVNAGYECGIGTAKFHDWQEGDIIEAYEMAFKRRTLALTP